MNNNVIVICGPTASGKTSLGIEIAKRINGEIISADSMQLYKYMNVGTAKPTEEEKEGIPHHMLDICTPDEEYNVSRYKEDATKCIEDIISRGKTPIIVGGTGLYIDTLVRGIEFNEIENDIEYRNQLEEMVKENGIDFLFEELTKVDPESAKQIDKNNVRRVIRALEIYKVTGRKKSDLDKESVKGSKYNFQVYGILWDREILYNRINERVNIMLNAGLVEEVKELREKYNLSKTALQGIGYKEVIKYLDNEYSYEDMVNAIKQESRRYAKRQMTWFNHMDYVEWLDGNDKEKMIETILKMEEAISSK